MMIREDLLHYIWKTKRFHLQELLSTEGEPIEIQDFGTHNPNAGPDFLNAKVKIGDTLWAGNVEMHVQASEWLKHGHSKDAAYENVILHVVLEEDAPILRTSGTRIPCLTMRKRIPPKLAATYQQLLHTEHWIPCATQFGEVPEITKHFWLDRLLVERLEQKTNLIQTCLETNQFNWEETFYQVLARNFGVKVNAEPFERLAQSIPLLTLAKHKDQAFQIEALLFGQAGLLDVTFNDEYPKRLQKEYQFLQKKHQLTPMRAVNWKFLRLRPANFPSIRIAQFAQLIYQSTHLFRKLLEAENVQQIEQLFQVQLGDYWHTHYVFDKPSKLRKKTLGAATVRLLLINTVAPFLFLYGAQKAEDRYQKRALELLEALPPESNTIITGWKALGMKPESAYQTQALIQLKNVYCTKKRCLECAVGNAILR